MKSIGTIPPYINGEFILEAIGENIILADRQYNVVWMNPAAVRLLSQITSSYGIEKVEDLIGINMSHFHRKPEYQAKLMEELEESHRARIHIKDKVVTDIVINPIRNKAGDITGYVVMLMDVTSKVEEEKKRERLIHELSVPFLHIWDNALALPLTGSLNMERFDLILTKLLEECQKQRAYFAVIDLSGISEWHEQFSYQLDRMITGLAMMGTDCLMVGVRPDLARQLSEFATKVPTFSTMKAATQHIISR